MAAVLARLLLSPPQAASAIKLLRARAQGPVRDLQNIREGVHGSLMVRVAELWSPAR